MTQKTFRCDTCGLWLPESDFVETIEEYLCEDCASGMGEDDEDLDDDEDYGE